MTHVLLLGAGKIGRMIARFLVDAGDYSVCVADVDAGALDRLRQQVPALETRSIDAGSRDELIAAMTGRHVVISALSFHFNPLVAEAALAAGVSYFDLTEDIATTRRVREVARDAREGQIFMPQCGLAPGFVS
ncbi:MAG: saccharopine dehydrogenase family protein, partial [Planctomycetaceae bacterium]